MSYGYLPKDEPTSRLPKTVMRAVWNNTTIVNALGLRNEDDARQWFATHSDVHIHFRRMNTELERYIEELQARAVAGLQHIVVQERRQTPGFPSLHPQQPPPDLNKKRKGEVIIKDEAMTPSSSSDQS